MKKISLNGCWQGECFDGNGTKKFDFSGIVPGCVHTDLAGKHTAKRKLFVIVWQISLTVRIMIADQFKKGGYFMQETTDLNNFRKVDENSFSLNHRDLDTALFSISPNRNMSF